VLRHDPDRRLTKERQPLHTLFAWPAEPPDALAGLYQAVADHLDIPSVTPLDDPTSLPASGDDAPDTAVVAIVDSALAASDPAAVLTGLAALADRQGFDLVVVVGDGWLGTDGPRSSTGMVGAAAVSAVRSIAVRSDRSGRANAVCVPESLFGPAGSQRAPLAQAVETEDVANAVAFLLADTGGYLNGQVLFVNGGRHLFSSMTA
jgi:hypothetical protein